MTLGFSTKIKGDPTYFVEKIWQGIKDHEITAELRDATFNHSFNWDAFAIVSPKIHTIREDKKNRWKVSNKIHFVINNRTKNRFQFAPILKVKSIQKFEIKYQYLKEKTIASVFMDEVLQGEVILINCVIKTSSFTVDNISLNDGFESTNDFLEWFSTDFKGKMIHWTDCKY
jgi:hypothetical protein